MSISEFPCPECTAHTVDFCFFPTAIGFGIGALDLNLLPRPDNGNGSAWVSGGWPGSVCWVRAWSGVATFWPIQIRELSTPKRSIRRKVGPTLPNTRWTSQILSTMYCYRIVELAPANTPASSPAPSVSDCSALNAPEVETEVEAQSEPEAVKSPPKGKK